MKTSAKSIMTLAAIVLSTVLAYPLPAQARPRRSSGRAAPARSRRKQPSRGSDHGLTLNFDLGNVFTSAASRRWVPGHYQTRTERVLVEPGHHQWRQERVLIEPGHYETNQTPALRETLYDSRGHAHSVVVKPGRTTKVWIPARYEIRKVKVYVPPRYETRQVRVHVPGHWVSSPARQPVRSWLNLGAVFRFKF